MSAWPKASPRYASIVRKVKRCGHWEFVGFSRGERDAVIRHRRTGKTLSYPSHDGGNEMNSSRNFGTEAGSICGCRFVEPRNRRRSRRVDRSQRFIDTYTTEHHTAARERLDRLRGEYVDLLRQAETDWSPEPLRRALQVEAQLRRGCQPPPVGNRWLSERLKDARRAG